MYYHIRKLRNDHSPWTTIACYKQSTTFLQINLLIQKEKERKRKRPKRLNRIQTNKTKRRAKQSFIKHINYCQTLTKAILIFLLNVCQTWLWPSPSCNLRRRRRRSCQDQASFTPCPPHRVWHIVTPWKLVRAINKWLVMECTATVTVVGSSLDAVIVAGYAPFIHWPE